MSPRIDVILPLHGGERWVEEAVQSVLAQTFDDWHLWAVDDASPDASAERVEALAAQRPDRIEVLRLERPLRAAGARIEGPVQLTDATDQYVGFEALTVRQLDPPASVPLLEAR